MLRNTPTALPVAITTLATVHGYEGSDGSGRGTHRALIAGEHACRSKETLSALDRHPARHREFRDTGLSGEDDTGVNRTARLTPGGTRSRRQLDRAIQSHLTAPARSSQAGLKPEDPAGFDSPAVPLQNADVFSVCRPDSMFSQVAGIRHPDPDSCEHPVN